MLSSGLVRETAAQAIPLGGRNSAQAPVQHPPQGGARVPFFAVLITGQGLLFVFSTVEAQGGRRWAESEGLGRGSTFCFTLPR